MCGELLAVFDLVSSYLYYVLLRCVKQSVLLFGRVLLVYLACRSLVLLLLSQIAGRCLLRVPWWSLGRVTPCIVRTYNLRCGLDCVL